MTQGVGRCRHGSQVVTALPTFHRRAGQLPVRQLDAVPGRHVAQVAERVVADLVAQSARARVDHHTDAVALQPHDRGGLLVGQSFTSRPDLFGAVVCTVPLLDMQRYHKLLAGASWMAEYGNPDLPEEWAYIKEYSPYQNVREDVEYPRPFIFTTTRDNQTAVKIRVLQGESAVREDMWTGEDAPRSKREGDAVLGGSQNLEATLCVEVERSVLAVAEGLPAREIGPEHVDAVERHPRREALVQPDVAPLGG